jgi:plastocyanin
VKKKLIFLFLIVLTGVALFIGCSSKSDVTPQIVPGTANAVTIKGFVFSPSTITIKAGSTVTWTNTDSMPHTVTELNGLFDSGNIATSATYTHTFASTGTFTYHCLMHSMMASATVVVTN